MAKVRLIVVIPLDFLFFGLVCFAVFALSPSLAQLGEPGTAAVEGSADTALREHRIVERFQGRHEQLAQKFVRQHDGDLGGLSRFTAS